MIRLSRLVVDLCGEAVGAGVEDLFQGGVVGLERLRLEEVSHVVAAAVPGGVRA